MISVHKFFVGLYEIQKGEGTLKRIINCLQKSNDCLGVSVTNRFLDFWRQANLEFGELALETVNRRSVSEGKASN